jgi:uncharacterized protein
MILVDANLLIYAIDEQSPYYHSSKIWWDEQLSGTEPVALYWPVIQAFLRITTNPRISPVCLRIEESYTYVESWLSQPCTLLLQPTSSHREIFKKLLTQTQATGNLISDASLAALAIEHGCILCSADGDFARFPGLKWRNPLM